MCTNGSGEWMDRDLVFVAPATKFVLIHVSHNLIGHGKSMHARRYAHKCRLCGVVEF